MRQTQEGTSVVTLFASAFSGDRRAVRLYAESHPEIRLAAILSSGDTVVEHLSAGMAPQVIVIDLPLPDIETWELLYQIQRLSPDSKVLLTAQMENERPLQNTLSTFRQCSVILKPWRLTRLFEAVFTLGTTEEQSCGYKLYNRCGSLMNLMQADGMLFGHRYLREAVVIFLLSEENLNISEIKRRVAKLHKTDEDAVTSAINRLNREMARHNTPLYQRLRFENGCREDRPIPLGRLIKSLANELRYYPGL